MSETASFAHKGIEITCLSNGHFAARVDCKGEPVDICNSSLADTRGEIDKVLARERSRRSRPSIPVYLFDGQKLELMEWRGFQSNSGRMLITDSEGAKKKYEIHGSRGKACLIPAELVGAELLALHEDHKRTVQQLKDIQAALGAAVREVGVELPSSWDLRGKSEEYELAVRGKLEELVRQSRIKVV